MPIPKQSLLLRIFVGEDHKNDGRPLYEAIMVKAREMGLAGVTVLRGAVGYGHTSRLHAAKVLRISLDLPLVIEIVDSEEKINAFLPALDEVMTSGLVRWRRPKCSATDNMSRSFTRDVCARARDRSRNLERACNSISTQSPLATAA